MIKYWPLSLLHLCFEFLWKYYFWASLRAVIFCIASFLFAKKKMKEKKNESCKDACENDVITIQIVKWRNHHSVFMHKEYLSIHTSKLSMAKIFCTRDHPVLVFCVLSCVNQYIKIYYMIILYDIVLKINKYVYIYLHNYYMIVKLIL